MSMKKSRKKIKTYAEKTLPDMIRTVLVSYAKTQLLLTLIVTVVVWIILSRLGVQFALLLALMTGAASTIPIAGMLTMGIITSLVAIFDTIRFLPALPSIWEGVAIGCTYVFLNVLIDYFLSPYLVGRSVKINPFVLLLCVLIGSSLFGIWGALLTTPVILVVRAINEYYSR